MTKENLQWKSFDKPEIEERIGIPTPPPNKEENENGDKSNTEPKNERERSV